MKFKQVQMKSNELVNFGNELLAAKYVGKPNRGVLNESIL